MKPIEYVNSQLEQKYSTEHWANTIQDFFYDTRFDVAIDLGCGPGSYTYLASYWANNLALGLDVNREMVDFARNFWVDVPFAHADVCHLPLRSNVADLALCIGITEYVDRPTLFAEVRRILKPHGKVIILAPNRYSAARIPGRIWRRLCGHSPLTDDPSRGEMLRLFSRFGFKVLSFKMDDGLVRVPRFFEIPVSRFVESLFRPFGRNPFSNLMLFVVELQ